MASLPGGALSAPPEGVTRRLKVNVDNVVWPAHETCMLEQKYGREGWQEIRPSCLSFDSASGGCVVEPAVAAATSRERAPT